MKPTNWNRIALYAAGLVTALGMAAPAFSQESLEQRLDRLEKQNEETRKNNEILQKQNEALMKLLQNNPPSSPVSTTAPPSLGADDVRNIVNGYMQEKEAKQAKEADAAATVDPDGRYRIGSDLRMSANWQNGLVISTPNKDFSMHIGGWVQYDNVGWSQTTAMRANPIGKAGAQPGIGSGVAAGGIGNLQDGSYFRRIRLQTDGKFWENYEYTLTLAFENDQFETVGLDEFWVGATNIPLIGTARLGHVKNAIGIEADMSGSSKVMTFLERSSYSEGIELNQNFVTGLWLGNNYFDQRATWSTVLFTPDNGAASGAYFGDGQWGAQGRLTALPLYQNDGRCLLHLGLSGGWRATTNNINGAAGTNSNLKTVTLQARAEMRDDDPAGSASLPQALPNSNSNRMLSTGPIVAASDFLLGTEVLYILGPLSIQGEYGFNFVNDATGFVSVGNAGTPAAGKFIALPSAQNYTFSGGYLQLAYTLTGENRAYDKRLGRLDSYYFGRQGLRNNAWFVRDEDGRLNFNTGAVELAARYSYLDLNDGTGKTRIQGGIMNGLTLGVNWYLNDNAKLQLQYVYDNRFDVPSTTIPGYTSGVGIRMQFSY
jgi:phosphate-selective porin OprO and OprP